MSISIILIGILSTLTISHGAPVDEVRCEINPFQKSTIASSLLLDNHLMCPTSDDFLKPSQVCVHEFHCPLDFGKKMRNCVAVCQSDGTWSYTYPTCEDQVPLAKMVDVEVVRLDQDVINKRNRKRRRRMAKYNYAKAILETLNKDDASLKSGEEANIRKKRSFGWSDMAQLEKPAAKSAQIPVDEPSDLIEQLEIEETADKEVKKSVVTISKIKLKMQCRLKMCKVVRSPKSCQALEDYKKADFKIQTAMCHICVRLKACDESIDLFTG